MSQLSPFAAFVWAHWFGFLWTTNIVWWGSEIWILARDLRPARETAASAGADRSSRLVLIVAIAVSITAALWSLKLFPFARLADGEIGAIRFAGGILCMWVGIAIRVSAVLTLGRLFRSLVVLQEDHHLVTTGLYAKVRNPSYTGALLTMFGQGLTMGNWISLIICVTGLLLGLVFRIRVEERALREHFGAAFDEYARRTWALVPGVW